MATHRPDRTTAPTRSFSVLYVAGLAALWCIAVLATSSLTDEWRSGFVGSIERPVLVVVAGSALVAGTGSARAPRAAWPLLTAVAAAVLVLVLTFLTVTTPGGGAASIFEAAAALTCLLLWWEVQRRRA